MSHDLPLRLVLDSPKPDGSSHLIAMTRDPTVIEKVIQALMEGVEASVRNCEQTGDPVCLMLETLELNRLRTVFGLIP